MWHGDLKPGAIPFVPPQSGSWKMGNFAICDFGVAKLRE